MESISTVTGPTADAAAAVAAASDAMTVIAANAPVAQPDNDGLDLSKAEIGQPIFGGKQKRRVRLAYTEVVREEVDGRQVQSRLKFSVALLEPATTITGATAPAGTRIFDSMMLRPTGKSTVQDVINRVGRFQVAWTGEDRASNGVSWESLIGKECIATLNTREDNEGVTRQSVFYDKLPRQAHATPVGAL